MKRVADEERPRRLPLSKEDLLAFAFWWMVGLAVGTVLNVVIWLATPIPFGSDWLAIPPIVTSVLAWKFWWWARNP